MKSYIRIQIQINIYLLKKIVVETSLNQIKMLKKTNKTNDLFLFDFFLLFGLLAFRFFV